MLLPFDDFNLILGVNWLTKHDAIVNCRQKQISLKFSDGELVFVEACEAGYATTLISTMLAQKLIKKGYEAYLAYILDSRMLELRINQVLVVREFSDVFCEELLGLLPIREVEFVIELVPGMAPTSIAPRKMAPTELNESKA